MSTFSIATTADWYTAIVDSHLGSPVYTTYQLTSAITFTSTNPPYRNSGTADIDYLYISAGRTFNGQGYLILLQNGCQPANGIAGIFRAVGVSGNTANFLNVNIEGAVGLPWDVNGFGSVFISSLTGPYDPNYVNVQYGIIQANTIVNVAFMTWVMSTSGGFGNITMDSVYMYLNNTVQSAGAFLADFGNGSYAGPCSITNCVFSCQNVTGAFFALQGVVDTITPTTFRNCYFYSSAQSASSSGAFLIGNCLSNLTLTNIYLVFSTYSSNFFTDMAMLSMISPATATLTNVYTNNTQFTNAGSGSVSGSANTSFIFTSAPTFGAPNGFEPWVASVPNLLTAFTTTPFVSSAYTTFDSVPVFSDVIPCLCRGMKILTPSGPIPVESLTQGDVVLVPPFHDRSVEIQGIFCRTYVGTHENVPVRIPKDFFDNNIPSDDILLSPHHAIFCRGTWQLPCQIPGLKRESRLIGKSFEYFHVRLPEYYSDKLWCHNMAVDSWDNPEPFLNPLTQEASAVSFVEKHAVRVEII